MADIKIAKLIYEIGSDVAGLVSGLKSGEGMLASFGNKVQNNAALLRAVGMAATAAGGAIVGALGLAVKSSVQFDQAARNAFSIVNDGVTTLQDVKDATMAWGRETVYSATESAGAYYKLASAGLNHKQIVEAGTEAIKFAVGTNQAFDAAAETLTLTVKSLGLSFNDTGKVANTFAASIMGSNLNADRLRESLTYALPAAGAFGVGLEELSSYLMIFHDRGMMGSMAGNALQQAMVALSNISDKTAGELDKFGLSVSDISPRTNTLAEIIAKMAEAGMESADMFEAFGMRGGRAMALLTTAYSENNQVFSEYLGKLDNANALQAMYQKQMEGAENLTKLLTSAIEYLRITVGDQLLPVFKDVVTTITSIIVSIGDWMQEHQELSKVIIYATGVLGGLLLVLGGLLLALSPLVTTIKSLIAVKKLLVVATHAVTAGQSAWLLVAGKVVIALGVIAASTWAVIEATKAFVGWIANARAAKAADLEADEREEALRVRLAEMGYSSMKEYRDKALRERIESVRGAQSEETDLVQVHLDMLVEKHEKHLREMRRILGYTGGVYKDFADTVGGELERAKSYVGTILGWMAGAIESHVIDSDIRFKLIMQTLIAAADGHEESWGKMQQAVQSGVQGMIKNYDDLSVGAKFWLDRNYTTIQYYLSLSAEEFANLSDESRKSFLEILAALEMVNPGLADQLMIFSNNVKRTADEVGENLERARVYVGEILDWIEGRIDTHIMNSDIKLKLIGQTLSAAAHGHEESWDKMKQAVHAGVQGMLKNYDTLSTDAKIWLNETYQTIQYYLSLSAEEFANLSGEAQKSLLEILGTLETVNPGLADQLMIMADNVSKTKDSVKRDMEAMANSIERAADRAVVSTQKLSYFWTPQRLKVFEEFGSQIERVMVQGIADASKIDQIVELLKRFARETGVSIEVAKNIFKDFFGDLKDEIDDAVGHSWFTDGVDAFSGGVKKLVTSMSVIPKAVNEYIGKPFDTVDGIFTRKPLDAIAKLPGFLEPGSGMPPSSIVSPPVPLAQPKPLAAMAAGMSMNEMGMHSGQAHLVNIQNMNVRKESDIYNVSRALKWMLDVPGAARSEVGA